MISNKENAMCILGQCNMRTAQQTKANSTTRTFYLYMETSRAFFVTVCGDTAYWEMKMTKV